MADEDKNKLEELEERIQALEESEEHLEAVEELRDELEVRLDTLEDKLEEVIQLMNVPVDAYDEDEIIPPAGASWGEETENEEEYNYDDEDDVNESIAKDEFGN